MQYYVTGMIELSKPIKGLATRLSLNTRNKRYFPSKEQFNAMLPLGPRLRIRTLDLYLSYDVFSARVEGREALPGRKESSLNRV